MSADTPTTLYRHFANDGSLLYVGISLSWPARTKAHSHYSKWFEQIAKVEIERFPSRAAALEAEREAIRRERPKFNVVHNGGTNAPPKRLHKLRAMATNDDPLLRKITGPDAIVGPALVYSEDVISMLIAHGSFGTAGELIEVVIGRLFPDLPQWTDVCDNILTIRRADEITIDEARDTRRQIINKLGACLSSVQAYDTDLALAVAYATQFPSQKSRQVLDAVAAERGAAGK